MIRRRLILQSLTFAACTGLLTDTCSRSYALDTSTGSDSCSDPEEESSDPRTWTPADDAVLKTRATTCLAFRAISAQFEVGAGTAPLGSPAWRIASGAPPATAATTSACVSQSTRSDEPQAHVTGGGHVSAPLLRGKKQQLYRWKGVTL